MIEKKANYRLKILKIEERKGSNEMKSSVLGRADGNDWRGTDLGRATAGRKTTF